MAKMRCVLLTLLYVIVISLNTYFVPQDGDLAGADKMDYQVDMIAAAGRTEAAVENKVKITTKYMTKYERARLLGTRALQIR